MAEMMPEQEARYALNLGVARSDLSEDAQQAYDRLAEQRTRAETSAPVTSSLLDRVKAIGTLLVGIAAIISGIAAIGALIFSSLSIGATENQLRIAEQGQITDRYNAGSAHWPRA
jgi:anti-sigma factor RsiW